MRRLASRSTARQRRTSSGCAYPGRETSTATAMTMSFSQRATTGAVGPRSESILEQKRGGRAYVVNGKASFPNEVTLPELMGQAGWGWTLTSHSADWSMLQSGADAALCVQRCASAASERC
eukprot:718044-Rhodomonas_salina.1